MPDIAWFQQRIEDHNKYRQYNFIVNRDKIVLGYRSWSNTYQASIQDMAGYWEKKKVKGVEKNHRFIANPMLPFSVYVWSLPTFRIDPAARTWTVLDDLWPNMAWRINKWLPRGIRAYYYKHNRYTDGQFVCGGTSGEVMPLFKKGLVIHENGQVSGVVDPAFKTEITEEWVPYIRKLHREIKQRLSPYEPMRTTCDSSHHTFGYEALVECQKKPVRERAANIVQWIESESDVNMDAYADILAFAPYLWRWKHFNQAPQFDACLKKLDRAIRQVKCGTPLFND